MCDVLLFKIYKLVFTSENEWLHYVIMILDGIRATYLMGDTLSGYVKFAHTEEELSGHCINIF